MLIEVTKTMRRTLRRASDFTSGTRSECWGADSVDGVWHFERIEDVGTPWIVTHKPTGTEIPLWFGTLKSARLSVTCGSLSGYLPAAPA